MPFLTPTPLGRFQHLGGETVGAVTVGGRLVSPMPMAAPPPAPRFGPVLPVPATTGSGDGSPGEVKDYIPPWTGKEPTTTDPTTVVIQLFQPSMRSVVTFQIERYGCMPEVPDPTPTLDGYVLLSTVISPLNLDIAPDGLTPIYRISGRYEYSLVYGAAQPENIPFSVPAGIAWGESYINTTPDEVIRGAIQV